MTYDAAYQSGQSSPNRFPPYGPVQNENRTKNEYYLLDNNSPSPRFEPRSAGKEAPDLPMSQITPFSSPRFHLGQKKSITRSGTSDIICFRKLKSVFSWSECVKRRRNVK